MDENTILQEAELMDAPERLGARRREALLRLRHPQEPD
jgi:hypothetical protein